MRTYPYSMADLVGPKEIVREGFNRVSTIYRPPRSPADALGHTLQRHREWLEPLFRRLRRGADVLDLGCGCGVPDAKLLAERFRVTGIDISDVQIARARRLVPSARFVRADMTEVALPPATFEGVVCLYALIHVPLEEQQALLARVARWLTPGGLFLVTTGWTAWTGTEEGWLGSTAKMYWSHTDAATYGRWLERLGFRILRRDRIPEGEAEHALFLGQLGDASK
jgi:ubiquinone/menaquinone biosynthesis C-methylase UbiE